MNDMEKWAETLRGKMMVRAMMKGDVTEEMFAVVCELLDEIQDRFIIRNDKIALEEELQRRVFVSMNEE